MKTWTNLHSHDVFSLLDGHGQPERYAERAKQLGMPALAVTNHGNVAGILDHYEACKKFGIKPILGIELYQARKTRFDRDPEELAGPARDEWNQRGPYHLTVLARNEAGYRNLIRLSSRAYLEGFYGKPRGDHELLADHADGLIVGSGCLNGQVQQALLRGDYDFALSTAATMQEIFGEENYFIEVQNHGIEEQLRIMDDVLKIAKAIGAPLVATGDCHYVYADDHDHHDTMLCVGASNSLKADENRFRFEKNEFYLKSYEEMLERHESEWLDNSVRIAEMVELELKFDEFHFPVFPDVPKQETAFQYMERLTWEGLRERYGEDLSEEVVDRAKYELSVVERMNFPDYFLVVADLVNWAKDNGIRVGFGRGSAAGSIISYALGITGLDPLKFGLMFERFLNPDRVSMPDIDLDFDSRYRERVIQYARERYGENRVAHIATYQTVKARSAIRDAARVLGFEYAVGNEVANLVPNAVLGVTKTLKQCMDVPDFRKAYETNPDAKKIIDAAMGIEHVLRQPGIHAAGVVITKSDLTDYVPVMLGGDKKNPTVVTQVDYRWAERLGLLKIDFLALRNLDIIDETERILRSEGIEIEAYEVPLDDEQTFQALSDGTAVGVFQLESTGMRDVTAALQPDSIYDIMALISLYRPGPLGSGMHTMYINRKHGREKLNYPHPSLEEDLRDSRGIMLYQEDVLNVITRLAGWSAGEADDLRRVIGKKKLDEVASYRPKFVEGCMKHSEVPQALAEKIFSEIEYFAGYGFNRAHAASYAMISYITAYLKAHYPVEYMCALMSSVTDKPDKLSLYLRETRRLGVEVQPPSINESMKDFSVVDEMRVRFGLGAVTGIGDAIIGAILSTRPPEGFSTLYDFFRHVHTDALNKGTFEKMVRSGMLDELVGVVDVELSQEEKDDLLNMERIALGVYITEHPLDDVSYLLASQATTSVEGIQVMMDGEVVRVGGILTEVTRKTTKRGDPMYILGFEDLTGSIEVLVFPRDAKQWDGKFAVGDIILLDAKVSVEYNEDGVGNHRLFFSSMQVPDLPKDGRGKPIVLKFGEQPPFTVLETLEELIEGSRGNSPVYFEFPCDEHVVSLKFKVGASPEIEHALREVGEHLAH